MAARVSQVEGPKAGIGNFLLMHAMGPNVAGVIGSAIAAGVPDGAVRLICCPDCQKAFVILTNAFFAWSLYSMGLPVAFPEMWKIREMGTGINCAEID